MLHGKCDKCETCVHQADLISSAEETICPDCVKGSDYGESYTAGLKRKIEELEAEIENVKEWNVKEWNVKIVKKKDKEIAELTRDLQSGINIVNKQIKKITELKQTILNMRHCSTCTKGDETGCFSLVLCTNYSEYNLCRL